MVPPALAADLAYSRRISQSKAGRLRRVALRLTSGAMILSSWCVRTHWSAATISSIEHGIGHNQNPLYPPPYVFTPFSIVAGPPTSLRAKYKTSAKRKLATHPPYGYQACEQPSN